MPAKFRTYCNSRFAIAMVMALVCGLLNANIAAAFQAAASQKSYLTKPIADKFQLPDRGSMSSADWNKARGEVSSLIRTTRSTVSDIMEGSGGISNPTLFDEWFTGYIFPSMTQLDNESLDNLGRARRDFFRTYLQKSPRGTARTKLIEELAIPTMKEIVEGNYHPAVRVNAMVLLSRLNVSEGQRGGSLPVPHPGVLQYLVQSLDNDALPGEVKVAAMAGIVDHLSMRITENNSDLAQSEGRQIADKMLVVLQSSRDDAPSKPLHQWMQRRAVQILGLLRDPGDGGKYASALRNVIADKEKYIWTRVDAVDAYSKLRFTDAAQAAPAETARLIAEMVVKAAKDDAHYINATIDHMKTTAMILDGKDITESGAESASSFDPGLGRGVGIEDESNKADETAALGSDIPEILPEYQRNLVRRRFKAIAHASQSALVGRQITDPKGLSQLAEEGPQSALIVSLAQEIDAIMKATDVKHEEVDPDDEDQPKETLSLADKLVAALNNGADSLQKNSQ